MSVRVLIVDDHAVVRAGLKLLLETLVCFCTRVLGQLQVVVGVLLLPGHLSEIVLRLAP